MRQGKDVKRCEVKKNLEKELSKKEERKVKLECEICWQNAHGDRHIVASEDSEDPSKEVVCDCWKDKR